MGKFRRLQMDLVIVTLLVMVLAISGCSATTLVEVDVMEKYIEEELALRGSAGEGEESLAGSVEEVSELLYKLEDASLSENEFYRVALLHLESGSDEVLDRARRQGAVVFADTQEIVSRYEVLADSPLIPDGIQESLGVAVDAQVEMVDVIIEYCRLDFDKESAYDEAVALTGVDMVNKQAERDAAMKGISAAIQKEFNKR